MPLLLADASPIIAFCNGRQHDILERVVRPSHDHLEVPFIVNLEVHDNCNRVGAENYLALKARGFIVVYDEPKLYGPDDDVMLHALEFLDLDEGDYRSRMRNGGEAFAVAYACRHAREGVSASILMDDRVGRDWARREGIPVKRSLWVFEEARNLGLLATAHAMTAAYEDVRRHTGALRPISEEPQLVNGLL